MQITGIINFGEVKKPKNFLIGGDLITANLIFLKIILMNKKNITEEEDLLYVGG